MARDNTPLLLIALHPKCKLFEIERGLPEYLETPLRASVRPFVTRVRAHTYTRARLYAHTYTRAQSRCGLTRRALSIGEETCDKNNLSGCVYAAVIKWRIIWSRRLRVAQDPRLAPRISAVESRERLFSRGMILARLTTNAIRLRRHHSDYHRYTRMERDRRGTANLFERIENAASRFSSPRLSFFHSFQSSRNFLFERYLSTFENCAPNRAVHFPSGNEFTFETVGTTTRNRASFSVSRFLPGAHRRKKRSARARASGIALLRTSRSGSLARERFAQPLLSPPSLPPPFPPSGADVFAVD